MNGLELEENEYLLTHVTDDQYSRRGKQKYVTIWTKWAKWEWRGKRKTNRSLDEPLLSSILAVVVVVGCCCCSSLLSFGNRVQFNLQQCTVYNCCYVNWMKWKTNVCAVANARAQTLYTLSDTIEPYEATNTNSKGNIYVAMKTHTYNFIHQMGDNTHQFSCTTL